MLETAAFFRLMISLGWIEHHQIVAWADALLVQQDEPDPALIDVAMAEDCAPSEMEARLHVLSRNHHPTLPTQMLFAYIQHQYDAGAFHVEYIVPTLYGLVRSDMITLPYDLEIQIDALQQMLDDAGHGIPDALDDIEVELLTCLSWGDSAARLLPNAYL